MSETPRLSGGYASTGISMLMSDEDEKENYLDSASRKIKIADDYDSGLADAKQLQAQIFFIQKQEYKKISFDCFFFYDLGVTQLFRLTNRSRKY